MQSSDEESLWGIDEVRFMEIAAPEKAALDFRSGRPFALVLHSPPASTTERSMPRAMQEEGQLFRILSQCNPSDKRWHTPVHSSSLCSRHKPFHR